MDLTKLNFLKKSRILHLCFAITFFTSGLVINFIQCILFLTLRKVDKVLYRKINWYLDYSLYSQLVFIGEWWSNSDIVFYANRDEFDKYFGKEHAYCVMNHTYEIDWLIGWMICERIHVLGNVKAYAKKVIQYMPILGWAWKFSEFVFLERVFEKDKENIHKQVGELADHPDPIWLLLFPEGTRFTPQKHKASAEFARSKNLPELKHHLQPRTKGFIVSLSPMEGKVPAVYDILLAFKDDEPNVEPTMTNLLMGKGVTAHIYFKRIPLEDVPKTLNEQERFLREMFVRKDKLKESFLKTGDFFQTSGIPRQEPFRLPRRIYSLLNIIFWVISILFPIGYYLLRLLFSGELLYLSIGISIIGIFFVLLNKTIGMSEIKKGSSYGSDTPKKVQ